jgi:predicted nucleic acid-binding protein
MAIVDTTFLIDLMKEVKARRVGRATVKFDELVQRGETLTIAVFTIGELNVGVAKCNQPPRERKKVENCLKPFGVLPIDASTAIIYGEIVGTLEKRGQTISDMDALIASVALENAEILVTRNVKHFIRIPALQVEDY